MLNSINENFLFFSPSTFIHPHNVTDFSFLILLPSLLYSFFGSLFSLLALSYFPRAFFPSAYRNCKPKTLLLPLSSNVIDDFSVENWKWDSDFSFPKKITSPASFYRFLTAIVYLWLFLFPNTVELIIALDRANPLLSRSVLPNFVGDLINYLKRFLGL